VPVRKVPEKKVPERKVPERKVPGRKAAAAAVEWACAHSKWACAHLASRFAPGEEAGRAGRNGSADEEESAVPTRKGMRCRPG
jgi:hypothetical protein